MSATGTADRIFVGTIITMDDAHPAAEAVAVAGGKIAAVGSKDDVMAWKGASTEVVDLQGRTLVPGFLDGHSHFINAVRLGTWANVSAPPAGEVQDVRRSDRDVAGEQGEARLQAGRVDHGLRVRHHRHGRKRAT